MVAITYRTDDSGQWGNGKGANLTADEIDQNFWNLVQAIADLGSSTDLTVQISNFNVVGDQLTVYLEDGTSFGPFTLPTAQWVYAGEWEASTAYVANTILKVDGEGIFRVKTSHTSSTSFDANDNDGAGHAYYEQIFNAADAIPAAIVSSTASTFTPTLDQANSYIRLNSAVQVDATIPSHAEVPMPVKTELFFVQAGAGQIVFTWPTDVTVNLPSGKDAATAAQFGVVCFKQYAIDAWDCFGALADVSA